MFRLCEQVGGDLSSVGRFVGNHKRLGWSGQLVDIDGAAGVRVTAEVVNADPESVAIGQTMKVGFLNIDDIWFPRWEPAQ